MTQPDLFPFGEPTYPYSPGHRGVETSIAAAQSIDARTLQKLVVGALAQYGEMTADEIAARLGLSILSTRPRCTELKRLGRIRDTGERRPNASGRNAAVFSLAA